ncbi:MAG: hypothetical protein RLZZ271_400, partial [Pseudomonadota bacterium]
MGVSHLQFFRRALQLLAACSIGMASAQDVSISTDAALGGSGTNVLGNGGQSLGSQLPTGLGRSSANAPEGISANQLLMLNRLGANPNAAEQLGNTSRKNDRKSDDDSDDKQVAKSFKGSIENTEFQRFVAGATGRNLPLFGYNLFGHSRFSSLRNVPVPSDYVIGPGDEIVINIWGSVEGSFSETVDRNGQISLPKLGTFQVNGIRSQNLESHLRTQFGRIYKGFQLNANVGRLRSIQIFAVGQARAPGTHLVSNVSTLLGALFEIGGPNAAGSLRNIQVKRDDKIVATFDFYNFITVGDKSKDIRLLAGDVIVFPPAGPRVAVLGALESPAIYELASEEESIQSLLGYGGGVLALTSPHKAILERIKASSPRAPRSIEERVLDAKGLKSTVRDADILTLFKVSQEFANAVTLRGNVAAPLRYSFRNGMRISDLIPDREALIQSDYYTKKNSLVQFESGTAIGAARVATEVRNYVEEINWDYAVVERLNREQIKTNLIHFNLYKAVIDRNPEHNLQLQPGDVVTIFGVNDVPVPQEKRTRFVTVGGEVKIPGVYQLKPGDTLAHIIQRAGGYTGQAYPYGLVFTRESNRVQQQAQLDKALHEMELEVSKLALTRAQNAETSGGNSSLSSDVAMQQQLLNAMRRVKPSGRVALELDPQNIEMPTLLLEDGDKVTVPARPSFVGVYGAVFADSSLLHRQHYSASDYLRAAGLKRDADLDNALIIRADGSVIGSNASALFG